MTMFRRRNIKDTLDFIDRSGKIVKPEAELLLRSLEYSRKLKRKAGEAYAFFNYQGPELEEQIEQARVKCNFDNLVLKLLSTSERKSLPQELLGFLARLQVYGSMQSNSSQEVFEMLHTPVRANELEYAVKVKSRYDRNPNVAYMTDTILTCLGEAQESNGVFRGIVLYKDKGKYVRA